MKRMVYVGTAVLAVALFGCQRRSEQRTTGDEQGGMQEDTGAYGGGTQSGQEQTGQAGQESMERQGQRTPTAEEGQQVPPTQQDQQGSMTEQGQQQAAPPEGTQGQTGAYGTGTATEAPAGAGDSCAQVSTCFSKISDQLCRNDTQCQATFSARNVPQSESACQAELSRVNDMIRPYTREQSNFSLPAECNAKGSTGQGEQGQHQQH